jgi:serine/threonine-protein kinase
VIAVLIALALIGGGVAAYLLTRPTKDTVPSVVLLSINDAQAKVEAAGFSTNIVYRQDSHQAGLVINQFPLAGRRLDANSTVTLTVSSGPGAVNIPQVSGLLPQIAERKLRRAHFKIDGVQMTNSATVPKGQVIGTSPPGGQSASPGTGVTVIVSSGKAPVNVPNVQGDSQANGAAALRQAGFQVNVQQQQSSSVMAGNVISQSPAGGTTAPASSTVTIVVAQAPTAVAVPQVVGDTRDSARRTLKAAGFKVAKQTEVTSQPNQQDIVISQSPSTGTAAKGSTVTIVVGVYQAPSGPTGSSGSTGATGTT